MAKNIEWMGAVFPDVPSICLPQQETGEFVEYTDTSDGDIQPADVTQGKIGYAQGQRVVGTATPSTPTIQSLSVTENGTYTAPSGVDGYSPVTVNVPGIVPTGSQTYTENGTYDVTALAEAVINVAGGGGASNVVTGEFTTGTTEGKQTINIPYTGNGYPLAAMIYVKNPEGGWKTFVGQYAIGEVVMVKGRPDLSPKYNGSISYDTGYISASYKSSATSATKQSAATSSASFMFYDGFGTTLNSVNRTQFASANRLDVYVRGTSYGYAPNITYGYCIIYST